MLTITLSQSQTSTVFFLNNSQLFHSFILCFCSSHCFHFTSFCIYFIILHSIFIRRRLYNDSRKLKVYFLIILASERFYLFDLDEINKKIIKINYSSLERLSKVKRNGVFLFPMISYVSSSFSICFIVIEKKKDLTTPSEKNKTGKKILLRGFSLRRYSITR